MERVMFLSSVCGVIRVDVIRHDDPGVERSEVQFSFAQEKRIFD